MHKRFISTENQENEKSCKIAWPQLALFGELAMIFCKFSMPPLSRLPGLATKSLVRITVPKPRNPFDKLARKIRLTHAELSNRLSLTKLPDKSCARP